MATGRQLAKFEMVGLVADPAAESLPPDVWTGLRDVMFRDHPTRVKGLAEVFGTPLFPPQWLQFGYDATGQTPVWVYAGATGIAYTDGAGHFDITPADWLPPTQFNNPWSGGILNNVIFCSNQRRAWYWDGVGVMLRLPDWGDTDQVGTVRAYQYHLIAMATDDGTDLLLDEVRWSAAANPGSIPASWTPAAANEAGSTQLSSTSGAVIDGRALRGTFMVYKNTSAYSLTYVGGSVVMLARLVFSEGGMLTRNCVAGLAEFHLVLTDGDVILHDGQVARSLAEGRVRKAMFSRANGDSIRKSFVVTDENNGEVWVCMPEAGSDVPNLAWVWNRRHDSWAVRTLPEKVDYVAAGQVRLAAVEQSWEADPAAWDTDPTPWDDGAPRIDFYQLLEASSTMGAFYAVDGAFLRVGAPINALIQRTGITLGDAQRVKVIKAVWIESSGTPGTVLRVRIGATMLPGGAVVWEAAQLYTVGLSRKVDSFASGRYLAIEISSSTLTEVEPWEIVSVTFEYEVRGLY